MANQNKTKESTQAHLDIDDITENLILLKSSSVAMILTASAVNFDILSEAEQDATIYAYAAFLNSLSFPLQVLIRSKKADIAAYYQHLEESVQNQPNPDLKRQIQKYMEFIKSTVQQKAILDKQFYLIIAFSPLELGLRGIKKSSANKYKSKADLVKDAQVNLFPKRDHIIKQAARLGLAARQLLTKELIELFYDIYNPSPTGTQRIVLDTDSLTTPLVKPAVESPQPAPEKVDTQEKYSQPQTINPSNQTVINPNPVPNQYVQSPSQNQQAALKNLKASTDQAASFVAQRQQVASSNYQQGGPVSPTQGGQPSDANQVVTDQTRQQ